MKLKDGFVTYDRGGEYLVVATGNSPFKGLIRANSTGGYVIELLKNEITETGIVDLMEARYDAPRELLEKNVAEVIEKLRSVGALEK